MTSEKTSLDVFCIEIMDYHLLLLQVTLTFASRVAWRFFLFGCQIPMSMLYQVQITTVLISEDQPRSDDTFSSFPYKDQRNAL